MMEIIENLIAGLWNRSLARSSQGELISGLRFGTLIRDGQVTRSSAVIPHSKRAEHIAVLGRTGSGKSSLLRYLS